MLASLPQQLQRLENSSSLDDLGAQLHALLPALGYQSYTYFVVNPARHYAPVAQRMVLSSYPPEWQQRYRQRTYHARDPVVAQASHQRTPVVWGGRDYLRGLSPAQADFMREARGFGLVSGCTLPVYGPHGECALFSLVRDDDAVPSSGADDPTPLLLRQLAQTVHHRVAAQVMPADPGALPVLSAHERACLLWTLHGKTAAEIADTLHRSKATVDFHLQKAMAKLQASNKVHAAFKALEAGLLGL